MSIVVDKVVLGQILLGVRRFSSANIIPPGTHTHVSSAVQTQSHPMDKTTEVVIGGVMVRVLAIGPKVRGFKPGRG
jgi:hypothetical protein